MNSMALRITRILQQTRSARTTAMNRPRNRQPRQNRGGGSSNQAPRGGHSNNNSRGGHSNNNNPRGGRGGQRDHLQNNHPRPAYPTSVPNTAQVTPGAQVSIVLKQDQPTGREVQGVVQDLLTRGNHPRGIKVRLSDGRVGRVQRMVGDGTMAPPPKLAESFGGGGTPGMDMRDDGLDGPPPRTLADYIQFPSDEAETAPRGENELGFTTATAKCPICGLFEGDEIAVSRHAEEHFT